MITVRVNGKSKELEGPLSLMAFLQQRGIRTAFIAVAHNGVVLRKEEYQTVTLQEGDALEIVQMVGGG